MTNTGHEDLRKYGPYNVDRSPSGRLVSKGSIDNPIEEYPASKTKQQKGVESASPERRQRGRSSVGRREV
jgi:hypothetical protein